MLSGKKALGVIGAIAAVALMAGLYMGLRQREVRDYIESTGVIEATEVNLTPKIAGRIEWLCCREGDAVKKGGVAVRLENTELKARLDEGRAALDGAVQSLNEARVGLENAVAQSESARYEVDAAGAEEARAKALTDEAGENLRRAEGLFKEGFLAKKDLDAARAAYDANRALLNSSVARRRGASSRLRSAEVGIKAARARIASAEAGRAQAAAQLNVLSAELKDTEITVPIDGAVVYRSFEPGEFVNPGASIYTVDDLANVWARLDIEETDIGKIRVGDRIEARTPGSEKAFSGRVIEIGEVGGFATRRDVTRGRPDIKTFRVKAGIERPDGALKPGMTVGVRIFSGKR